MKARAQKRLISLALLLSQFQVFLSLVSKAERDENSSSSSSCTRKHITTFKWAEHAVSTTTCLKHVLRWRSGEEGGERGFGKIAHAICCDICVCLAMKSVHTVPCLIFALIILFVSKHAAMSELVFPDWLHSCPLLFPINIRHRSHLPQHTCSDDIF